MGILDNFPLSEQQAQAALDKSHNEYWEYRLKTRDNPRSIRVKGVQYWLGDDDPNERAQWKGFGGATWRIRRIPSGEEFVTHDLWRSGDIPEDLKEQLPDNAEFIRRNV
jgi:hypothetical protein